MGDPEVRENGRWWEWLLWFTMLGLGGLIGLLALVPVFVFSIVYGRSADPTWYVLFGYALYPAVFLAVASGLVPDADRPSRRRRRLNGIALAVGWVLVAIWSAYFFVDFLTGPTSGHYTRGDRFATFLVLSGTPTVALIAATVLHRRSAGWPVRRRTTSWPTSWRGRLGPWDRRKGPWSVRDDE